MNAIERRNKILKILCKRKSEKVANLANEFGVSERTILRDIVELSFEAPIYTVQGRYYGGVYIDKEFSMNKFNFEHDEQQLLEKIINDIESNSSCSLNQKELAELKKLLSNHTNKKTARK